MSSAASASDYLSIPEYKQEGGETFFLIKIVTANYKASIHRTYEQFNQFDIRWRSVFPNVQYTLSGGGLTLDSRSPDYSEKRRVSLEKYLKNIVTVYV